MIMNDNYGTPTYNFVEVNPEAGVLTRQFLANLKFRVFNDSDYMAFAGVESPVPLIAEVETGFDSMIVIIDGATAELYTDSADGSFELTEVVECINELPHGPSKAELIREARVKINELQATLRQLEAQ
jgi:hypothetical protein